MKHLPALPHGPIERIFDDVFCVRGAVKLPVPLPVRMSRSMTILRERGELCLVNAMRLSEAGLRELDALGRVANVIRIGAFHGRDDGFYRERNSAKLFAVAGQRYTRKVGADPSVPNYLEPNGWLDATSALPVEGAKLFVFDCTPPEAALLVEREGGILVTADALQNLAAPDAFVNFLGRRLLKRMHFFKPHGLGPGWLRSAEPRADDVARLLDWPFEHVLPGHGEPVIGGAREKYRPAIEALGTPGPAA